MECLKCTDSHHTPKVKGQCRSCYHRSWRTDNEEQQQYRRDLYKKNASKIIDRARERRHTEIEYRLKVNLRSRLGRALKIRHPASTIKSLGCTVAELKIHLESKFQSGMTWENYGQWEIDHVRPLISFNLKDAREYAAACHYTNLEPLWVSDNRRKNGKWFSQEKL